MSLLNNNSYHILGLDTSASQKEVSKRSKEILTRLKIDDVPVYDLDLPFFKHFRTEDSVKEAVDNLSSPKRKIKEFFFWFQIIDNVDEEAIGLLRKNKPQEAIDVWQSSLDKSPTKSLFYKKNLAVLYCLLLLKLREQDQIQDIFIEQSLAFWSEIVESDKFWNEFLKVYTLYDDVGTDETLVKEFRNAVSDDIADIYTELSKIHKDQGIISQFSQLFGLKGVKIETDVLNPIYKIINDAVENLENLHVSDDGVLDKKESEEIKRLIGVIQTELNKLIDLGLYNESKIKVVRDRAASALRKLSIELNNQLNETSIALGLSKIAEKMAGLDSFKNTVQQDIRTLQENHDYKNKEEKQKIVVDPILADFHAGKTDKAIKTINEYIYNDSTDSALKETLIEIKEAIEKRIVKTGKPVAKAPTMHTINGIGTTIYGDTIYFVFLFIPIFATGRYNVTNHGGGSYSFEGKLELHKWQVIYNWVVPAVIILWIIGSNAN